MCAGWKLQLMDFGRGVARLAGWLGPGTRLKRLNFKPDDVASRQSRVFSFGLKIGDGISNVAGGLATGQHQGGT